MEEFGLGYCSRGISLVGVSCPRRLSNAESLGRNESFFALLSRRFQRPLAVSTGYLATTRFFSQRPILVQLGSFATVDSGLICRQIGSSSNHGAGG